MRTRRAADGRRRASAKMVLAVLVLVHGLPAPTGAGTGPGVRATAGHREAGAEAEAPSSICPFLSVIATGRNDDYGGGDFAARAQRWLDQFGDMAALPGGCQWFEVLLVEWKGGGNATSKESFVDVLVPPPCVAASILSVPEQVHAEHVRRTAANANAGSTSFLEYHAKNVALRRMSRCSQWVLLTNPDALFSLELLGWLSHASFPAHHFIRARRVEITDAIPAHASRGTALFTFLWQHTAWPADRRSAANVRHVKLMSGLDMEASGDFLLAPAAAIRDIRGGVEVSTRDVARAAPLAAFRRNPNPPDLARLQGPDNVHHDTRMLCALAASGLQQLVLPFPEYVVFHQQHTREERLNRSKAAWDREHGRSPLLSLISDCRLMFSVSSPYEPIQTLALAPAM